MTDPISTIAFIMGLICGLGVASLYWVSKFKVGYCPKCDINWNTTNRKCMNCQTKLVKAKYCPQKLHSKLEANFK